MAANERIDVDRELSFQRAEWRRARARARRVWVVSSPVETHPLAEIHQDPPMRELLARPTGPTGRRMNHRSVWVLQVVGAEPGLSNKEVGQRVGVTNPTHIGEILRRLRRSGLVLNTQEGRTPQKNAWQLTSAGSELERAISRETPGVGEMSRVPADGFVARSGGREPLESADGMDDPRHARILAAVVRVAFAEGVHAVSAERVARVARVSRDVFDDYFVGREVAVLAAFEFALAQAGERVRAACGAERGWLERVRVSLLALLEFCDEQPALAMLLVVGSAQAGPGLQARRSEVLGELARLLDNERAPARSYPPLLTAQAVVGGVLNVLHERLCQPQPGGLIELSGSLMSFIVTPFLGAAAARRELSRPAVLSGDLAARKAAQELLHGFSGRGMRHPLAPRVLHVIRTEPGLSNTQVAERTGVGDEGHMSRTLARLRRLGLIESGLDKASRPGRASMWRLTSKGEEVERALRYEVTRRDEQAERHRELWLAQERRASSTVAVFETGAAFARCRARAQRMNALARAMARPRVYLRLVRLAAFALPLLHCIGRVVGHALHVAVAAPRPWLNKRSRAPYSIPFTECKLEPLRESYTASTGGSTHLLWQRDKQRARACQARARPGHFGLRKRPARYAERRGDHADSSQHTCSPQRRTLDKSRLRRFL